MGGREGGREGGRQGKKDVRKGRGGGMEGRGGDRKGGGGECGNIAIAFSPITYNCIFILESRAVNDPNPAVCLMADQGPGGKMNANPCGSGSSLTNFVKN